MVKEYLHTQIKMFILEIGKKVKKMVKELMYSLQPEWKWSATGKVDKCNLEIGCTPMALSLKEHMITINQKEKENGISTMAI